MDAMHNLNAGLLAAVEAIERDSGGILCFAVQDLQTGEAWRYRADHKCRTASIIKFPILVHIALAVFESGLTWKEMLTLTAEEKVGGSGILTQLTPGTALSIRDICVLMTVLSDNTGTNMLIERLGVAPINARMRSLGLPVTTVFRKSFQPDTPESAPYGWGVTTPEEMLSLIRRLAADRIGDAATSADLIAILEQQFYRDAIPRYLPADWRYAGKTGSLNACRNDVGLVTLPDGRRFGLSLFCQDLTVENWTADNPGLLALARLARLLLPA